MGVRSPPVRASVLAAVAVAGVAPLAAVEPPAAAVEPPPADDAAAGAAPAPAMAASRRAVAAGVKSKMNVVTFPAWMVSRQVASRLEMPSDRNESRDTVPENVTTSGVTATGVVMSAWKLPAARSRCQAVISAVDVNCPVAWTTMAPGPNIDTAVATSWAFSAAISARATDTASVVWAEACVAPTPPIVRTAMTMTASRLMSAPFTGSKAC
jgi:hypothetical protein